MWHLWWLFTNCEWSPCLWISIYFKSEFFYRILPSPPNYLSATLPICLSVTPSICLTWTVHPPVSQAVHPNCPSDTVLCQSHCPFTCLSHCPFLPSVCHPVYSVVCQSHCPSHLSVTLAIHLSISHCVRQLQQPTFVPWNTIICNLVTKYPQCL